MSLEGVVWASERARDLQAAADKIINPPPKITKATQPTLHETLWRCSKCGKWSHAKRRPRAHTRFMRDSEVQPEVLDFDTAERVFGELTLEGQTREGGWRVPCGPFEEWEAWKVESP